MPHPSWTNVRAHPRQGTRGVRKHIRRTLTTTERHDLDYSIDALHEVARIQERMYGPGDDRPVRLEDGASFLEIIRKRGYF